jgi:FMN reductase
VGVGGATRQGSTTEKCLRYALGRAEALGCRIWMIAGPDLPVEPYDPARPDRSAAAADLVDAVRRADGLIVASPGYHGSVSGLVKNALDYIEDLRSDSRPYLDGRAFGAIVTAEGPQALGSTLTTLRSIAHALRAWPTPYAALVNASQKPFASGDATPEPGTAAALDLLARQVVEFARMRAAYEASAALSPA